MKKLSRRVFLSVGGATAAVTLSQLMTTYSNKSQPTGTLSPVSSPSGQQTLNLYSSRHYNTDTALYEGFTKETGIKVNLVVGKVWHI